MPASAGLQRAARIIGAGSALMCLLVLLTAWSGATTRKGEHAPSRLLEDARAAARSAPPAQTTKLAESGYAYGTAGVAETCDCARATKCTEILETELKPTSLQGGGAKGLSRSEWGAWDPVTGVPRIGCVDTVTHAHYTRFKEDGVEYISPTNRFYGSTVFAPQGKALSKRGYKPNEEADALCTAMSGSGGTPAPKNEGDAH